ncbi:hypothetical protein CLAIMM_06332 [Cladophialophora immunda]|nr:hypothetical protein CLAIMM_06332 [Cladophialophora immunda]
MPKLHFVQELPVGSSRRDRELERAKARAHAASVSYQSHHHHQHRSRDLGSRSQSQSQSQSHTQFQPQLPTEKPVALDSDDRTDTTGVGAGGRRQHQFVIGSNNDIGPSPPWDDSGGGGGGGGGGGDGGSASCASQHGLQTPPQSPPQEGGPGRDSSGGIASLLRPWAPWAADTVADSMSRQALTPPDVSWAESGAGVGDGDGDGDGEGNPSSGEDMGDIDPGLDYASLEITGAPSSSPYSYSSSSLSSSSSSSSALILPQTTATRHSIYQINPHAHAQTTAPHNIPWTTPVRPPPISIFTSLSTSTSTSTSIPHDLLGTRADPFDCIPRRHADAPSVAAVVDYHAQIMAPNHAPIYKIFDVTNVYTGYYFELLAHPDFLYTGVASVQAVIDHLRRAPGAVSTATTTTTTTTAGPSENVLRHIGTAMVRLRRRLGRVQKEMREEERAKRRKKKDISSGIDFVPETRRGHHDGDPSKPAAKPQGINNETLAVDDMTIMTVLFLAVVTRAINDLPSHEIHKRTLASLVAARGGLQNLTGHDGLARCTLMQWESFWALNTGSSIFPESRPTYQPVYPRSPPIPASSPLGRQLALLPRGFQALAHHRRLALDVLQVLSRTAEAHLEQMRHGTIVTPSDVFRTKPRKFRDFWEACTCLGAPDEVVRPGLAGEDGGRADDAAGEAVVVTMPNLEKMIVLALLLYCLHTFSPMRAVTAVYNGSRMKLTTDAPRRTRRSPLTMASVRNPGFPSPLDRDGDVARESGARHTRMETERDKMEREEDVLLWVWFNLVDSWRAANDTLLPQGRQIMHALRLRFPERTATWEECEGVLTGFFWNDAFIRRCRAFWIVSERKENG